MPPFLAAIPFPAIDPVIFSIGPLAIRWYALSYILGIVLGWRLLMRMADDPGAVLDRKQADDLVVWVTLGVILGGRIGYILFYNFDYFIANPGAMLRVWEGGMSFHGGLLGVIAAIVLFARSRKVAWLGILDMVAVVTPLGLLFGRIANFINGELFGRPTDVPWAVIFPRGGDLPRHPSQLYEAALEGLVLFIVLYLVKQKYGFLRRGLTSGVFLTGYALARSFVELFRQPDPQIGFLFGGATMGQLLSLPMLLLGLWLIHRALHAQNAAPRS